MSPDTEKLQTLNLSAGKQEQIKLMVRLYTKILTEGKVPYIKLNSKLNHQTIYSESRV